MNKSKHMLDLTKIQDESETVVWLSVLLQLSVINKLTNFSVPI